MYVYIIVCIMYVYHVCGVCTPMWVAAVGIDDMDIYMR